MCCADRDDSGPRRYQRELALLRAEPRDPDLRAESDERRIEVQAVLANTKLVCRHDRARDVTVFPTDVRFCASADAAPRVRRHACFNEKPDIRDALSLESEPLQARSSAGFWQRWALPDWRSSGETARQRGASRICRRGDTAGAIDGWQLRPLASELLAVRR